MAKGNMGGKARIEKMRREVQSVYTMMEQNPPKMMKNEKMSTQKIQKQKGK